MPPDPPKMSHAFGARLHDHSHSAGFATAYKKYSFGRLVTSICGVAKDSLKNYYLMIYVNGKSSHYGVDGLKQKDGDLITFKFKKLTFK